jgi:hypothetical protein
MMGVSADRFLFPSDSGDARRNSFHTRDRREAGVAIRQIWQHSDRIYDHKEAIARLVNQRWMKN